MSAIKPVPSPSSPHNPPPRDGEGADRQAADRLLADVFAARPLTLDDARDALLAFEGVEAAWASEQSFALVAYGSSNCRGTEYIVTASMQGEHFRADGPTLIGAVDACLEKLRIKRWQTRVLASRARTLSPEESADLLDMLRNPPAPNDALRAAADRFARRDSVTLSPAAVERFDELTGPAEGQDEDPDTCPECSRPYAEHNATAPDDSGCLSRRELAHRNAQDPDAAHEAARDAKGGAA